MFHTKKASASVNPSYTEIQKPTSACFHSSRHVKRVVSTFQTYSRFLSHCSDFTQTKRPEKGRSVLNREARLFTTCEVCFVIPRGPSVHPPCSPSSIPSSDLNVGMPHDGWGNTRQSQHGAAYINSPVQMSCQTIAANQNFCSFNWPPPSRLNKNSITFK